MTKLTKTVVRATGKTYQLHEIVHELRPLPGGGGLIVLRLKGQRTGEFAITVYDLYDQLYWKEARRVGAEKAAAKQAKRNRRLK